MTPTQHIVVATDFGPASIRALEVAAEIAKQFGARVTVLHVVEDRSYASGCPAPPEIRRAAAFRLDEAVHDLRRGKFLRSRGCSARGSHGTKSWQEPLRQGQTWSS